jgi:hypothetical protein
MQSVCAKPRSAAGMRQRRVRANQEPGTARTAPVELAPTVHHRRSVITATTAYLQLPFSVTKVLAEPRPEPQRQAEFEQELKRPGAGNPEEPIGAAIDNAQRDGWGFPCMVHPRE